MMEEDDNEGDEIDPKEASSKLKEWLKRDMLYIAVLIFALVACLYTMASVENKVAEINNHWLDQWETICPCQTGTPINATIKPLVLQIKGDNNEPTSNS